LSTKQLITTFAPQLATQEAIFSYVWGENVFL